MGTGQLDARSGIEDLLEEAASAEIDTDIDADIASKDCIGGQFVVLKCDSLRGTPTPPERYTLGVRSRSRTPQFNIIVQIILYAEMKSDLYRRTKASRAFSMSVHGEENPTWAVKGELFWLMDVQIQA